MLSTYYEKIHLSIQQFQTSIDSLLQSVKTILSYLVVANKGIRRKFQVSTLIPL